MTTQGELSLTATLSELENIIGDAQFYRCFRSFVVNLAHVRGLQDGCFLMSNGEQIMITRRNLTQAQNRYMDYLFDGEHSA